ncbi:hypothetical protein P3102_26725 [Amycolatopsis sp. QT-25]|uniref:hypothetical protein n=1 Tax=Amycolatopsis sp. QT-25 TaxID=3034022 RepID=UPI0023EB8488|nr:hypothetical protein [Amycolatopsis sp. QT-25]WET77653.1 hypothetical protein P3102_26725 [Amycolatopsis sp. QT-25]
MDLFPLAHSLDRGSSSYRCGASGQRFLASRSRETHHRLRAEIGRFPLIRFTGWSIAKAVSKAWAPVLSMRGFDEFIEKTGLAGTLGQANVDAGVILVELLSYFIL